MHEIWSYRITSIWKISPPSLNSLSHTLHINIMGIYPNFLKKKIKAFLLKTLNCSGVCQEWCNYSMKSTKFCSINEEKIAAKWSSCPRLALPRCTSVSVRVVTVTEPWIQWENLNSWKDADSCILGNYTFHWECYTIIQVDCAFYFIFLPHFLPI